MEKEDVSKLMDIATKSRVHGAIIGVLLIALVYYGRHRFKHPS